MKSIKELMKQLNDRVHKLEKEKKEEKSNMEENH